MKYRMQTVSDTQVRTGPGNSFSLASAIPIFKGTTIIASEFSNGWFKHDRGGWSESIHFKFLEDLELDESKKIKIEEVSNQTISEADDVETLSESELQEIEEMTSSKIDTEDLKMEVKNLFDAYENSTNPATMKQLKNTWGMPFQFLPSADSRLSNTDFGRKYYENIVMNMPLLSIIPGKPVFMKGQNNATKGAILSALEDATNDISIDSTLEEIMEGKYAPYYSFESDYTTYIQYVNRMCTQAAIYLGIGGRKATALNTTEYYKDLDWHSVQINQGNFSEMQNSIGFNKMVTFFMDSSSSMSDSASNETMESKLGGLTQNAADIAREAAFLIGPLSGQEIFRSANAANAEEAIKRFADTYSNDSPALVKRLQSHVDAVLSGSNLLFPEIWRDSSYTRSYNVTIRLHSPYGDVESVFLNVLVPFFHIISLCFPRQVPSSASHGYVNPFLVRAYCRSLFNCNLGIIDSVSFTKAPNNEWTVDGLPTEIEVSLSIKDLYSALTIYGGDRVSVFFSNTGLIDFIGTICGVNTYKKDITRSIESYIAFQTNKFTHALPTYWRKLEEGVLNKLLVDRLNF